MHVFVSLRVCFDYLCFTKPSAVSGATLDVTRSMSAFLACHPCYCVSSSLALSFNLWALVCGIF